MDWNSRRLTAVIENALVEDRATRDATSYACIDPGQRASATILAKQDCILAGIGCIARIFDVYAVLDGAVTSHYEVTTHPEIFDGVRLHKGLSVAVVRHNARVLLSCERVILNFLQRMSGIATLTRKFVDEVSGTRARILDTRKTAPGLRAIDKYAVRCGGGQNHRLDLSDGILLKNNHIALAGGIVAALERAHRNRRGEQPIEVEVRGERRADRDVREVPQRVRRVQQRHVVAPAAALERVERGPYLLHPHVTMPPPRLSRFVRTSVTPAARQAATSRGTGHSA